MSSTASAALFSRPGITVPQNILVQSNANTAGPSGATVQYGGTLGQIATTGNSTWNGNITLNQPINLTGGSGGTVTFTGNIVDGSGGVNGGTTFTFAGSNLTKTENGTVVLTGSNTYTGSTTLQAGSLIINGNNSGGGQYVVGTGATLGGSGVLKTGAASAGLQLASGGTLSPGTSTMPGTLSVVGDVTLDGTLSLRVGDGGTDVLSDTGALTVASEATLNLVVGSSLTAPAYILATYTTLNGVFANISSQPADYTLVYGYNNTPEIALVSISTLPEPATVAPLLVPGAFLAGRRRTRTSR